MDEYTFAIHEKDLPNGMMKTVLVGNKKIALANVDGEILRSMTHAAIKSVLLGQKVRLMEMS